MNDKLRQVRDALLAMENFIYGDHKTRTGLEGETVRDAIPLLSAIEAELQGLRDERDRWKEGAGEALRELYCAWKHRYSISPDEADKLADKIKAFIPPKETGDA